MLQVFYELTPNIYTEMQTVRYRGFEVGTSCNQGNPHTGKIPFDDPGGTLDIKGWRKVRVYETEASPTLLWSGRIRNKTVRRGDAERPSLRTGADRWWDCDAIDQNTLMPARIIRDGGNRPAESAGERLEWLLGTSYTIFVDNGHVTYPSNRLDANDYRLQTAANVLEDCALPGGYVYFALQTDDTDFPELFFMKPTSSDWASTVSISDNLADVDGETVFAPFYDASLDITDEQIAAGVAVPYSGGSDNAYVYVSDSDIGDEFAYVDKAAPMANVKTSAKALVIANRHLADSSTEAEQITCSVLVRADQANLIRPWHRIPYASTWMPNFATARDCRVLEWSIEQHPHPDGGDGYLIHLQLSPVDESVSPTSCSTVISGAAVTSAEDIEDTSPSVGITTTDDAVLVAWLMGNNGNLPAATNMTAIAGGYTGILDVSAHSRSTFRIATKEAAAGTSTASATFTSGFGTNDIWIGVQVALAMSSGTPVQSKYNSPGFQVTLDSTPTAGNIVLLFAYADSGTLSIGPNSNPLNGPTTGWTELFNDTLSFDNSGFVCAIYARCVESDETGLYSYAPTSGFTSGRAIFVAEFTP